MQRKQRVDQEQVHRKAEPETPLRQGCQTGCYTAGPKHCEKKEQRDAPAITVQACRSESILKPCERCSHQPDRVRPINRIADRKVEQNRAGQDLWIRVKGR